MLSSVKPNSPMNWRSDHGSRPPSALIASKAPARLRKDSEKARRAPPTARQVRVLIGMAVSSWLLVASSQRKSPKAPNGAALTAVLFVSRFVAEAPGDEGKRGDSRLLEPD